MNQITEIEFNEKGQLIAIKGICRVKDIKREAYKLNNMLDNWEGEK